MPKKRQQKHSEAGDALTTSTGRKWLDLTIGELVDIIDDGGTDAKMAFSIYGAIMEKEAKCHLTDGMVHLILEAWREEWRGEARV